MISKKFNTVPIDEDTRILFQQEMKIGEFEALYQKWYWDGVIADSVIFANEDIVDIDESSIIELVKSLPNINKESNFTFEKSESGFTFVNFNFEME